MFATYMVGSECLRSRRSSRLAATIFSICLLFGIHSDMFISVTWIGPTTPAPHLRVKFAPVLSKASWNYRFAPGVLGFAPGFAPVLAPEFERCLAKFADLPPSGADLFSRVYVPAPHPVS